MDSTACWLSASITPTPCVPCVSLSTTGGPPTSASDWGRCEGLRATTVLGIEMPFCERSCRESSLSRAREMGANEFTSDTPMSSNWCTTASA